MNRLIEAWLSFSIIAIKSSLGLSSLAELISSSVIPLPLEGLDAAIPTYLPGYGCDLFVLSV